MVYACILIEAQDYICSAETGEENDSLPELDNRRPRRCRLYWDVRHYLLSRTSRQTTY